MHIYVQKRMTTKIQITGLILSNYSHVCISMQKCINYSIVLIFNMVSVTLKSGRYHSLVRCGRCGISPITDSGKMPQLLYWVYISTTQPLDTRRCCDVESTSFVATTSCVQWAASVMAHIIEFIKHSIIACSGTFA